MGRTPTTDLTEAHEAWVDDNGIADRGHWQRVAKELTKRGGRAGRTKSLGRLWDGVTMRGPEQESAGQTANHSTGVTGVTGVPVNPGFTPYAKPTGRGVTPVTPTTKNERKRAEWKATEPPPTPVLDELLGPEPARDYSEEPF
jgi:hypothetical protein